MSIYGWENTKEYKALFACFYHPKARSKFWRINSWYSIRYFNKFIWASTWN